MGPILGTELLNEACIASNVTYDRLEPFNCQILAVDDIENYLLALLHAAAVAKESLGITFQSITFSSISAAISVSDRPRISL